MKSHAIVKSRPLLSILSLLALLALPICATAQERSGPDVWQTAGSRKADAATIHALVAQLGPNLGHRWDGGCIPLPEWGTGSPADEASARLVEIGSPAINDLLLLLKDKDIGRRRVAVEILGRIGNRCTTASLLPLLYSETDDEMRQSVAESLAMLRDPRAENVLLQALQDQNGFVQEDAARGLGWLKSTRAIAPLATLVRQQKEPFMPTGMRPFAQPGIEAATALGEIGPASVPALLDIVTDPDTSWSVLVNAIGPLGVIGDKRAVPILLRLLNDSDDRIRYAALSSLHPWPDSLTVPVLVGLLHDESGQVHVFSDSELGHTQVFAATLLAGLNKEPAREALEAALFSSDDKVRRSATAALDYITSPAAAPLLIRLVKSGDADEQHQAVLALGTLKDVKNLPVILNALGSSDPEMRRLAVGALGFFDDPRVLTSLLHSLDDPDHSVRAQAIAELSGKRDARILPALQRLTNDDDPQVRSNAVGAIQEQQKKAAG